MKTAIFIDIQNIYYTTRDTFGSSFNYRTFLQDLKPKHHIIKILAYAIDRKDEKQQKFQHALRSMGIDVKLKPYISRSDGSNKGDWDVGITIDVLEHAKKVEKIILLSGDGDFDILVRKVIDKYGCVFDIYGVEELSANSLIRSATTFHPISMKYLIQHEY